MVLETKSGALASQAIVLVCLTSYWRNMCGRAYTTKQEVSGKVASHSLPKACLRDLRPTSEMSTTPKSCPCGDQTFNHHRFLEVAQIIAAHVSLCVCFYNGILLKYSLPRAEVCFRFTCYHKCSLFEINSF